MGKEEGFSSDRLSQVGCMWYQRRNCGCQCQGWWIREFLSVCLCPVEMGKNTDNAFLSHFHPSLLCIMYSDPHLKAIPPPGIQWPQVAICGASLLSQCLSGGLWTRLLLCMNSRVNNPSVQNEHLQCFGQPHLQSNEHSALSLLAPQGKALHLYCLQFSPPPTRLLFTFTKEQSRALWNECYNQSKAMKLMKMK